MSPHKPVEIDPPTQEATEITPAPAPVREPREAKPSQVERAIPDRPDRETR